MSLDLKDLYLKKVIEPCLVDIKEQKLNLIVLRIQHSLVFFFKQIDVKSINAINNSIWHESASAF